MAVIFSGSRSFPQGAFESATLDVSARKIAKTALRIRVSMDDANFPNGTTSIAISVSSDGGVTFRTASMTVDHPAFWKGAGPNYWVLEYGFLPDEDATHVKYATNAPQAFTTNVIVEAF